MWWYLCTIIFWATSWQNQQNDLYGQRRQTSLDIQPVWIESLQCAQWVAEDPRFLHADSEDTDQTWQTGQMPRLIWVFAGCTCHFVGFVMMLLIYWNKPPPPPPPPESLQFISPKNDGLKTKHEANTQNLVSWRQMWWHWARFFL